MLLSVLVLLAAAGCAEKWEKPGATEAEFRAMEYECGAQAAEQYPPQLYEQVVMPARWSPPYRACGPRGCVYYPGYWLPPQTMVMDANQGRRHNARRACYLGNGWTPAED
jgi:hypothetical protein